MLSYTYISFIILATVAGNLISCYFRIWLYKELFHRSITIKTIISYGLLSAIGALGIIKISGISGLLSKAAIEESTKTLSGEISEHHILASDHIATAILAGLGFALVENCLYSYYILGEHSIAMGLVRIFTNAIVHSLFTGTIGFGIYQFYQKNDTSKLKSISLLIFFIGCAVGSHFVYNRALGQSYLAISFAFVIIGYFFLSYLLYKSDRLFIS